MFKSSASKVMGSSLVLALSAALGACSDSSSSSSAGSNNAADAIDAAAIAKVFPKSVKVFDVSIVASSSVPDAKILHAAAIMAEYLDNDEDGTVDNQAVVNRLVESNATLTMAADPDELERLFMQLFKTQQNAEKYDNFQDLQANETIPNGAAQGQFDGSLEEILHLITHVGFAKVYPGVFGEAAGSAIADAMDIARGGRFTSIPNPYPDGAWYTYDDETCTYDCMVTEYTYWALTSILGAQDFPGRGQDIQNEWQLNTRNLVQTRDAAAYRILTNPQYALPTRLPDGTYSAKTFTVSKASSN